MISECIPVRPTDALKGVKRELYTRKRNECYGCYMLLDKHGVYLVIAQKLHAIAAFINTIASDEASRISLTTLYEILDTHDNRVGGFAKHRWRIRFAPLEEAGSLFESERGRFEQSIIIGHPECYQIESM